MSRSHPVLALVTALYLLLLVAVTFLGGADQAPPPSWWSLLAFALLGALLCALSSPRRWWVALGFGMLGAAWVEAAQTVWMPPGYASVDDLALGVVGTALGVGAVVAGRAMLAKAHRREPGAARPTATPVRHGS